MDLPFDVVPTRFLWRYGGHQVSLVGSFTHWVEPVPLIPAEDNPGVFSVVVHLSPGYHQYKFIVDNVWHHDEQAPCMPDPNGNVNNWVFVRKPEQTGGELDRNYLLQQRYFLQELQNQIAEQLRARATIPEDVPMRDDIPHLPTERKEPVNTVLPLPMHECVSQEYTHGVIHDFLRTHTAFELIPESGKVVILDIDLSIRQAFHALHEQGIPSAALWDSEERGIVGVISARDFIQALKELRESVTSGADALTADEMDHHTIRSLKQSARENGTYRLVYVEPDWTLEEVAKTLMEKHCSMAPIAATEDDQKIPAVLHTATLGSIIACLVRHFQASISSLPLLSRPLSALPIGTWSPTAHLSAETTDDDPRCRRRVEELTVIHPDSPLLEAFRFFLEAGVSALPVIDRDRVLIDVYALNDITHLAKNHAYTRLQQEEVTVQQALANGRERPSIPEALPTGSGTVGGLSASFRSIAAGSSSSGWTSTSARVYCITRNDTLRTVVERLASPAIHRLMVIDASTRVLEGVISLSDVAQYLFIRPPTENATSMNDRICHSAR